MPKTRPSSSRANQKPSREPKKRRANPKLQDIFPHLQERIENLLHDRLITMSQLSRETKLARPTLTRLVRAQGNPLLMNYVHLAQHLGTTVASLLADQIVPPREEARDGALLEALVAERPEADPRAREIYVDVCRLVPEAEIRRKVGALRYQLPGEEPQDAITRAIIDVFTAGSVWIDSARVPRDHELEVSLHRRYELPERPELPERHAVRVVKVPPNLHEVVQIHALGAVGAATIRQLLARYSVLGASDGFACGTTLSFLRRGDLTKTELVPLTFSPRFIQYEMSSTTLVGALARNHKGYCVSATMELGSLAKKVGDVQVAVTACGAVLKPEPKSRLARLFCETRRQQSYDELRDELNKEHVVGDLMYHFLRADTSEFPKPEVCKSLEFAEPKELYNLEPSATTPVVYALSPNGLAEVARRGVVLLLVHGEERAHVAHAALRRSPMPVNFIVATEAAARAMDELLRKEGR